MISKLLAGKNIYFKLKNHFLGSLHGESDALFDFYRFNTFSTLFLIFINFGDGRKHIIFTILLVQIHIIMIMYLILS